MHIIVPIDKDNGMLFNNRRVSRDKILNQNIINLTSGSKLWMHPYSASLFTEYPGVLVSENFLDEAGAEDYCFVENCLLAGYEEKIDSITVCKWNRDYPSDMKLDFLPWEHGYKKTQKNEFAGASHEKITMEEWKRC